MYIRWDKSTGTDRSTSSSHVTLSVCRPTCRQSCNYVDICKTDLNHCQFQHCAKIHAVRATIFQSLNHLVELNVVFFGTCQLASKLEECFAHLTLTFEKRRCSGKKWHFWMRFDCNLYEIATFQYVGCQHFLQLQNSVDDMLQVCPMGHIYPTMTPFNNNSAINIFMVSEYLELLNL